MKLYCEITPAYLDDRIEDKADRTIHLVESENLKQFILDFVEKYKYPNDKFSDIVEVSDTDTIDFTVFGSDVDAALDKVIANNFGTVVVKTISVSVDPSAYIVRFMSYEKRLDIITNDFRTQCRQLNALFYGAKSQNNHDNSQISE